MLNLNIIETLSEGDSSSTNGGTHDKKQDSCDENDKPTRDEFILECSHRIVERISQVNSVDILERDLAFYLKEYTGTCTLLLI